MKRLPIVIAFAVVFATALLVSSVAAAPDPIKVNGAHYQLNILGSKSFDKTVGDSMGHTMFVLLNGKTKIIMTQAVDGQFVVTDRNGIDGTASFNIAPGHYNVFARAKGKPGGNVHIDAFGEFTDVGGTELLFLDHVDLSRVTGKPLSVNINKLFYVEVIVCTDQTCATHTHYINTWVFDIPTLEGYYWDYYNAGVKNLEVRFYECTLATAGQPLPSNYCMWANGDPIYSSSHVEA